MSMLSIIVSSCDKQNLSAFIKSVEATCGISNEIIVIENAHAEYSLTEAYNLGASQSKYPYLLFIHEDLVFKTQNWGQILLNYFKTLENVGIIGIAGAAYKPFVPSSWAYDLSRLLSFNLVQGYKYSNQTEILTSVNSASIRKMVCMDGVFLAVSKEVFDKTGFDEKVTGFHAYDTDFSLRVAEKFQNYFVPDILLQHFSEGKSSDQWVINTLQVRDKWKQILPISATGERVTDLEAEVFAYNAFINALHKSSLSFAKKLKILFGITFYSSLKTRSPKFLRALIYNFKKAVKI